MGMEPSTAWEWICPKQENMAKPSLVALFLCCSLILIAFDGIITASTSCGLRQGKFRLFLSGVICHSRFVGIRCVHFHYFSFIVSSFIYRSQLLRIVMCSVPSKCVREHVSSVLGASK